MKFIPKSVLLYKVDPFATYIILSFNGSILISSMFPEPTELLFCCTQAPDTNLYKLLYPANKSPALLIANGVTQLPSTPGEETEPLNPLPALLLI